MALAAFTVIVVEAKILVTVPEITPVELFRARPMFARFVAEAPLTVKVVAAPPEPAPGVKEITEPLVELSTLELGYEMPEGMISVTTKFTPIKKLPPELVAVMLNPDAACTALGVPVMAPVVVLKLNPNVLKTLADVASRL